MKIIPPGDSVAAVLRRVRLDLGISQSDLANRIGISASALNKVEHNKAGLDTDWIVYMPLEISLAVKDALAQEVGDIPASSGRRLVRRSVELI